MAQQRLLSLLLCTTLILFGIVHSMPRLSSGAMPSVAVIEKQIKDWKTIAARSETNIAAMDNYIRALTHIDEIRAETMIQDNNGVRYTCSQLRCDKDQLPKMVFPEHHACACIDLKDLAAVVLGTTILEDTQKDAVTELKTRTTIDPSVKDANFTYIPPPKTDITPDLLAESLAVQPQNTATVVYAVPYFADGVLSFGCQMEGFIASTIVLNASTEIPCDGIDMMQPVPNVELRPKEINDGNATASIPDCSVIAVNMYDPNVLTYWVQNRAGAIFSTTGSNKVVNIDQLNTTASTALILRAKSAPTPMTKRDMEMHDCAMAGQEIANRAIERAAA